jgi:hypothetical protein
MHSTLTINKIQKQFSQNMGTKKRGAKKEKQIKKY